ncbi:hypothetical protein NXX53_20990 [Bacteroides salyersiae]|nr:hypothetical protein [Bacteroides salyersiae]
MHEAESYITRIYSHKGKEMVLTGQEVKMNEKKWKALLDESRGDTLYIDIYPKKSRQRMGEIPTAEKQSGGGDRSLYILPVDRTVLCGI